jgi:hypothetical protein
MVLFVVVGVMNLAAMVVLAAVVLAEKLWVHGEVLARVVGIAAPRLRYRRDLGAGAGARTPRDQPDDEHGRIVRRYRPQGGPVRQGRRKPRGGSLACLPRPLEAENPPLALAVSG